MASLLLLHMLPVLSTQAVHRHLSPYQWSKPHPHAQLPPPPPPPPPQFYPHTHTHHQPPISNNYPPLPQSHSRTHPYTPVPMFPPKPMRQFSSQSVHLQPWTTPTTPHIPGNKVRNYDSGSQLSLREVLGENLEKEIFPSDGDSIGINIKDDPPITGRQRWSVSSFPPQLNSTAVGPASGLFPGGGGAWSSSVSAHQHGRHSVAGMEGTMLGSDQSWPAWSGALSQQPYGFNSLPSLGADSHWSPLPGQEFEGGVAGETRAEVMPEQVDLDELMKNLDIAEHLPVLRVRSAYVIRKIF